MADSSSESETSFNIEEVPEDNRDHVREVLAKAKQMAPFYSEYVLFRLYKSYFQADNVFYNELQIIINRRKEQDNGEGWITVGNKRRETKKEKYDFLKDKQLIWRANNWEKEEAKHRHARNQRENFQKRNNNSAEGIAPRFKEKQHSQPTNSYVEKRHQEEKPKRFKEKEVQPLKEQVKQETNKTKYAEKVESKEPEKVAEKIPVKVEAKETIKQVKAAKPLEKQEAPKESKNTSRKYKEKGPEPNNAEHNEKVFKEKQPPIEPVKEPVREQSKVESPKEPVKLKEPIKAPLEVAKEAHKAEVNIKKSDVDKNFIESIQKYPKILKFLKPDQKKVQKISYVWNGGSIDSVKVHVPLNQ